MDLRLSKLPEPLPTLWDEVIAAYKKNFAKLDDEFEIKFNKSAIRFQERFKIKKLDQKQRTYLTELTKVDFVEYNNFRHDIFGLIKYVISVHNSDQPNEHQLKEQINVFIKDTRKNTTYTANLQSYDSFKDFDKALTKFEAELETQINKPNFAGRVKPNPSLPGSHRHRFQ